MLVATACVGLFIVLDLVVTWTNYAALITLSGKGAEISSFIFPPNMAYSRRAELRELSIIDGWRSGNCL
jgi:hypothetical protein